MRGTRRQTKRKLPPRAGSPESRGEPPASPAPTAANLGSQARAGPIQPEYVHALINPIPIYGLAMAALFLTGALFLRNRPAQLLALWLVVLSAASAWPTYLLGE